jgi:hypothetical protein
MPAEPDNSKIEELLKAYGRKRREEAGSGFELHPAVRKMLQAEVAMQQPKPEPEKRGWLSLLIQFWPRFAFAGAALLVLSVVLWNLRRAPDESRIEFAKFEDKVGKELDVNKPASVADHEASSAPAVAAEPASRNLDRFDQADKAAAAKRSLQAGSKNAETSLLNQRAEMEVAQSERAKDTDKAPAGAVGERLAQVRFRDEARVSLQGNDSRKLSLDDARLPSVQSMPASTLPQQQKSDATGLASSDRPALAKSVTGAGQNGTVQNQPLSGGAAPVNGPVAAPSFDPGALPVQNSAPPALQFGTSPFAPGILQLSRNAGALTNSAGASLAYDTKTERIIADPRALVSETLSRSTASQSSASAVSEQSASRTGAIPGLVTANLEVRRTTSLGAATYNYFAEGNRVRRAQFSNAIAQAPAAATARLYGAAVTANMPLSSTFDVQQDGSRIQIVDSDGSVYQGAVVAATDPLKTSPVRARKPAPAAEPVSGGGVQGRTSFTASGTNRTLQKLVVIRGQFIDGAKEQLKAESAPAEKPTDSQIAPTAWLPEKFEATIRVERANESRVQATRVSR